MTPSTDQLGGFLRAILPILSAVLVGWGLDDKTAGLVAAGVVTLGVAAWSWFTNRPVAIAKSVAAVPGVEVVVGPSAPPALKAAAADPNIRGIVSK